MTAGRRGLAAAVVAAAVGAGLVLLGAYRVWSRETVAQPPPLSPQELAHTGASLAPALPAFGLVALAGAGALLATRGQARRVVGAVLVVAATAIIAIVVAEIAGGGVAAGWSLACAIGALVVGAGGTLTVRDGARWPVMGARYGRATRSSTVDAPARSTPASEVEVWDAIDRGEDPTRD